MTSKKNKVQSVGIGMTPTTSEFGSFIRARRLELDLGQVLLAKEAGLAQTLVSMIEIGKRKYLNNQQLDRLAKVLQCDVEELRKRMPVKHVAQPTTELGKLIRSRREELGLSLSVFAKKMKITLQRAKHLEIRKNPSIRYDFVELLATVLDLDLSVLGKFAGTTQKKTKSELGQLVRTRRKELAISIKDLAQKLNVSRQFVNQIEFGQCRLSENDEMIIKLAQVLELDINRLEVLRPERRLKQMENANPLGGFLAAKRLELRLTQREVSERAEIASSLLSGVETGRFHPSPKLLKKLTTILKCQIPSELITPPSDRKGFTTERETPLGQLVTTRRLELKFSQAEVARRANTSISVISSIERGTYRIGGQMVKRLSKALEFEIPIKFIPTPKQRGDREPNKKGSHLNLSDQNLVDLERIKELSDIRVNNEAVRKALKLLRILLEKQNDKYTVCLHKDKNIIELEFLF